MLPVQATLTVIYLQLRAHTHRIDGRCFNGRRDRLSSLILQLDQNLCLELEWTYVNWTNFFHHSRRLVQFDSTQARRTTWWCSRIAHSEPPRLGHRANSLPLSFSNTHTGERGECAVSAVFSLSASPSSLDQVKTKNKEKKRAQRPRI